jgi:hypothetical protein
MLLVSMLAMSTGASVAAASVGEAYIKFSVDIAKEDPGLAFNFINLIEINYTVEEGDVLEYDVWLSIDERGWGHVDGEGVQGGDGGSNWRDRQGYEDQNGVRMHADEDITEWAFNQWFRRVFTLPEPGVTVQWFQIAIHPNNDNLVYSGYVLYKNIVITNNGQEKLVIFRNAGDWNGETRQSHRRGSNGVIELLEFTAEDMANFAAAAEAAAKAAEEASISREEAEKSREASREQATIDASIKQSEEEAAAAGDAEGDDAESSGSSSSSSDDDEGLPIGLIIGIIAGVVVIIVIIIIIATKKKKSA